MIGPGEGVLVDFIDRDPPVVDRAFQKDLSGQISAAEDVHHNPEMCVGMLDSSEKADDFYRKVQFFLDFSDTGTFRRLSALDLSAGKLPKTPKQTCWSASGDQYVGIFEDDAHRDVMLWDGLGSDDNRKLILPTRLVGLTEGGDRAG